MANEPWTWYRPGMQPSRAQGARQVGPARAGGLQVVTDRCGFRGCVAEFVRSSPAQRFCSLECAAEAQHINDAATEQSSAQPAASASRRAG